MKEKRIGIGREKEKEKEVQSQNQSSAIINKNLEHGQPPTFIFLSPSLPVFFTMGGKKLELELELNVNVGNDKMTKETGKEKSGKDPSFSFLTFLFSLCAFDRVSVFPNEIFSFPLRYRR